MVMTDHETGKEIISPYILIGREDLNRYALNTESFRRCQDWLIFPDTIERDTQGEQIKGLKGDGTVTTPVWAVVGGYNRGVYSVDRGVSVRRNNLYEQQIGWLPLSVLEKHLPIIHKAITEDLEKAVARSKANPNAVPF